MAARFESIHLPHFLEDGEEAPAPVRRLAEHYGDLVRFASQLEPGQVRALPVRCRFRPGRRACGGLLVAQRQAPEDLVAWQCPACDAAGVVTGWQGTQADLRAMRRGLSRDVREVPVTVEALAALRDAGREDPDLGRLAFTAQVDADGRAILLFADDERRHYAELVSLAALTATRRAADLLLSIAVAFGGSEGAGADDPGLVAKDAPTIPGIFEMLLGLRDPGPSEYVSTVARRRQAKRTKRVRSTPAAAFQIKVTLRDVRPPVWRRLLVPSDILLPKLHDVLQAAMGWHDCHLHLFRVKNDCYAVPGDWEPVGEDSRDVALVDLAATKGSRLVYEYDFGDGWTHDIVVEAVLSEPCTEARCTGGRRRCPPEDCGGPWGYEEFLAALADPSHERHDELSEWHGGDFDPAEFDVEFADATVRRVAVE